MKTSRHKIATFAKTTERKIAEDGPASIGLSSGALCFTDEGRTAEASCRC
jgi:hypothetical protein